MTLRHHIAALVLAAVPLSAGQVGLHREGDYWVQTSTVSEAAGDAEMLKVNTIGNVTVRGGGRGTVDFTVTRKVRARNEADAREALQESGVSLTRQGRYVRLVVGDEAGPADLQVSVPRGLRAIVVATEAGNIDISDLDGSTQAQTGAGEGRVTRVKGSVDLTTAGGAMRLGDIGGWVRVNTAGGDITADSIGGEARLITAGGDITVQKAGAGIRAETAGGKVRIGQAGGAVIASTAGGMIDIGHAGGAVTAHNAGGGPILIGSAGGSVHCESASGAIKVGPFDGPMRLETASGSVVAQLRGSRLLSDSSIETGSGDITVFIPSNLSVTVRAQSNGAPRAQSIISEFPGIQVRLGDGETVARGEINGGGAVLRIECNSGTIWIKKK